MWRIVINEGSSEVEPIFGIRSRYFYQTLLGDPIQCLAIGCIEDQHFRSNIGWLSSSFLLGETKLRWGWGWGLRFTETLWNLNDHLCSDHFLQGKSMLENYNVVLILQTVSPTSSFQDCTFPWICTHCEAFWSRNRLQPEEQLHWHWTGTGLTFIMDGQGPVWI